MYPSKQMPYLGIFVRNIEEGLINKDVNISNRITISATNKNNFIKLIDYFIFYCRIVLSGLFGKYDLIYGHYVSHIAVPLLIVKLFRPAKIILNYHGSDIKNKSILNRILHYFAKRITQKASIVIVPSNYFKKEVLKFVNINRNKIYVSPSGGIDNIFYNKTAKKLSPVPVLGFVSHLNNQKGWSTFLLALKILKNDNTAFKAIVIGSANTESIELIERYNLSNEIEYMGVIEHKELPKYYKKMDLFIFPTCLEESLGLVGLEAMASSIPVIASQIGGITDYLEDGTNGFFFKNGNSNQLAERISHYINLPEERIGELSLNAYRKAIEFKHSRVIDNLKDELLKIHTNQ